MTLNPAAERMLLSIVARFARSEDRGVGDTVARILRATGIDRGVRVAAALLHTSCSCADRQAALNERYPYQW